MCFSAFPCGSTALTADRCNQALLAEVCTDRSVDLLPSDAARLFEYICSGGSGDRDRDRDRARSARGGGGGHGQNMTVEDLRRAITRARARSSAHDMPVGTIYDEHRVAQGEDNWELQEEGMSGRPGFRPDLVPVRACCLSLRFFNKRHCCVLPFLAVL
eukprot:SAG22_NODE_577_length_8975_cov_12.406827_2_plen_159_part_00